MKAQVVTEAINPWKMSQASISQVESILALPIYVRVGKWSGEMGSSNLWVKLSHSVLVVLLSSGHRDPLNSLSDAMLLNSGHRDPWTLFRMRCFLTLDVEIPWTLFQVRCILVLGIGTSTTFPSVFVVPERSSYLPCLITSTHAVSAQKQWVVWDFCMLHPWSVILCLLCRDYSVVKHLIK